MKFKYISFLLIYLMALIGISVVNAHGVDVTEDTMVIVNDTNAIETKRLVDNMNLSMKVYKFTSDGDVEHILEHALENPNKTILALSFQDVVSKYVDKHPDLSDRVIVGNDSKGEIEENLIKLNETASSSSGSNMDIDYITLVLIVVIIGLISGMGIFILKKK